VAALTAAGDLRLLILDEAGVYHFNGRFRNVGDVSQLLTELSQEAAYVDLVAAERDFICDLFETTFNHRAFTGRSGTFFAYEGLGSIYWHMVSKLLLAVQECYQQAEAKGVETAVSDALSAAYYDIRAGLSFNKTPAVYGAFPTDPYSHTPQGNGARQPGMTGQVKEEILTRWGELGLRVKAGTIAFAPTLLSVAEFLDQPAQFEYVDVTGSLQMILLSAQSLAFTFCQTPIIYTQSDQDIIEIVYENGRLESFPGSTLDAQLSHHIFSRDGVIRQVNILMPY
jgi:hypothetical protein